MITRTRTGPYTFADFLELIPKDRKADLLAGAIYMASPESLDHNDLVRWLSIVIGQLVEERQLGRVTINKVAYRLSDDTAPEPDLAFVRAERASLLKRGYVDGAPDLAIEIISPDSVECDYENKRLRYEEAGVAEYWIIDPDERKVTFLVREGEGFVEAPSEANMFRSRVIPGLVIDPRWFRQRPLPATLPIVRQMLQARHEERA